MGMKMLVSLQYCWNAGFFAKCFSKSGTPETYLRSKVMMRGEKK